MEDVTLSMLRYWNSRRPEELDVTACFPVAVAKVRLWCEPELKWVMLVEDQPRICSVMKLLWRKYQTINTIGKQQSIEVEAAKVSKDKLAKKVKAKHYFHHWILQRIGFMSTLQKRLFFYFMLTYFAGLLLKKYFVLYLAHFCYHTKTARYHF